ncbi:hypothetical protein ElyMa_001510600 [Elysia marginata]|uniref:Uncharacterized protein n=1 Tax=Elysia marginata TaxID=1093978 RepID=A0AAV4J5D9_9GAST|nr:hypothetical protein ElyMa_001510600 [Elysia marginata]
MTHQSQLDIPADFHTDMIRQSQLDIQAALHTDKTRTSQLDIPAAPHTDKTLIYASDRQESGEQCHLAALHTPTRRPELKLRSPPVQNHKQFLSTNCDNI